MRISALSATTGVPVHTIKYYLREGLLMRGELTSPTRAEYGEEHVARIRLIRALVQSAGVGIDKVRQIVAALENPPADALELFALAQRSVPVPDTEHPVPDEIRDMLIAVGWDDILDSPSVGTLAAAIAAARQAGLRADSETIGQYARAVETIAQIDVGKAFGATSIEQALLFVVAGTVMMDPILAALRRLAQQHVALAQVDLR